MRDARDQRLSARTTRCVYAAAFLRVNTASCLCADVSKDIRTVAGEPAGPDVRCRLGFAQDSAIAPTAFSTAAANTVASTGFIRMALASWVTLASLATVSAAAVSRMMRTSARDETSK